MTWLDWVIVAMLVYFVLQGVLRGVVAAVLGAVALVVSYVVAAVLLPSVGQRVAGSTPFPADWARFLSFIVMFLAFYAVGMVLISLLPGGKRPSMPAQVLGIFGGIIKALVAAMVLVGVVTASPYADAFGKDIARAPMARYVGALQKQYIEGLSKNSPIPFPPVGPDHKF